MAPGSQDTGSSLCFCSSVSSLPLPATLPGISVRSAQVSPSPRAQCSPAHPAVSEVSQGSPSPAGEKVRDGEGGAGGCAAAVSLCSQLSETLISNMCFYVHDPVRPHSGAVRQGSWRSQSPWWEPEPRVHHIVWRLRPCPSVQIPTLSLPSPGRVGTPT